MNLIPRWLHRFLIHYGPYLGALFMFLCTVITSAHAVLTKKNTRAAVGWAGLIWFAPIIGIILYALFGINRIQRKAQLAYVDHEPVTTTPPFDTPVDTLTEHLSPEYKHISTLSNLTRSLTRHPLLKGNRIEPLVGGDHAYKEMIQAIENASHSISLCTYLFQNDSAGTDFRTALKDAHERGVEVRVLIDDVGARYSFPSIPGRLKKDGIPVKRFMPNLVPLKFRYMNLRNHRKILVVDGHTGFTGGMNISEKYTSGNGRDPSPDLHFRVQGPVVSQLQETFVDDWAFTTGERLKGDKWFPDLEEQGPVFCKGIRDGPDEDYDKMRYSLMGAISCAERSIQIITPYFLPDDELISALNVAGLRNLNVEIYLPEKNNLNLVAWASRGGIEQLIPNNCSIYSVPGPFDHTKLMVVDRVWTLIGSTNWDPRSLKLNFEFNVECYSSRLADDLQNLFDDRRNRASEITLETLNNRSLPIKLRDGVARLFSPYL